MIEENVDFTANRISTTSGAIPINIDLLKSQRQELYFILDFQRWIRLL